MAAFAGMAFSANAAAQGGTVIAIPPIEVFATAPVPGSEIDITKVPSNVQTIPARDFDHAKSPGLLDALVRSLPGVSLGDQTGNQFQRELNYRGFTASPVIGTPQGIAVYQNGVRINEVFGDTVNWDFIPEMAINRFSLLPSNPVFGLNAVGGAVAIEMKNGFNYHGAEVEAQGGSFGRRQIAAQAGGQSGNLAGYVNVDAINDNGWRDASSSSRLRRVHADVGTTTDQAEFHATFTGADNKLGSVAATPVELLSRRWSSVFTWPQNTTNQLAFVTASGAFKPTSTFSVQGNAYFRGFRQSHLDGNNTDAQVCAPPNDTLICFGDGTTPLIGLDGNEVANFLPAGATLGQLDRTHTSTNRYGGSLQATSTAQIAGHDNHVVVGSSVDRGRVNFTANSELGTVEPNLFVTGTGVIINQPTGDVAPVSLKATTTYTGIYATNTFDITSQLSLTGGGRFNVAQIKLEDQLGTDLNGDSRYSRFNPVIGMTYKFVPNVTAYAGYSEANRAPTPLELGCADPARPCLLDNFLVSDPPLKQVVSHTYEAGLRGLQEFGPKGRLKWSIGAYRSDSDDDIINVASPVAQGFGFFQNAGTTRRQGVEASADYTLAPWRIYANLAFVDATFRTRLTLSSPNNPMADANGSIFVVPGNHIPAVPDYRFKAGLEYAVTQDWKVGTDVNAVGSQYLVGDQSNQNAKVPAYWVVNLNSSYQVTKNVEVFGLVRNLFNQHYYSAGTFFETGSIAFLNLTDPRTFVPGMPFAAYGGIRARF
ncbi:MAG: TonB-dependent receptor [Xanthobacteraceae bacterium]